MTSVLNGLAWVTCPVSEADPCVPCDVGSVNVKDVALAAVRVAF